MLRRIQLGKTPAYFIMIYNLSCKLKDYIKASEDDIEISKHVLQYYLLGIRNPNDLYERWVLCKLYAIANTYKNLKFRESRGSVDSNILGYLTYCAGQSVYLSLIVYSSRIHT